MRECNKIDTRRNLQCRMFSQKKKKCLNRKTVAPNFHDVKSSRSRAGNISSVSNGRCLFVREFPLLSKFPNYTAWSFLFVTIFLPCAVSFRFHERAHTGASFLRSLDTKSPQVVAFALKVNVTEWTSPRSSLTRDLCH